MKQTPAPEYVPSEEDKTEFGYLKGKIRTAEGKRLKTVEKYVEYRNTYFGSAASYEAEKATADTEFDAMKKGVWGKIGQKESKEAKKALYRWVRKAYTDAGVTDPVATIKAGMTPELKTKIANIKKAHPDLAPGGFLARPQKAAGGGYRLGSLSEHGTGKAFDITPQDKNPHLPKSDWTFLEGMTSRTVDRSLKRWNSDPAGLWQDVHDLNDAYVTELKSRISTVEAKRKGEGKDPAKPPPYEEVLAGHTELIKTVGKYGVDHGCFSLDKDLVVSLHGQGLRWGATFKDVDLHHFEIP